MRVTERTKPYTVWLYAREPVVVVARNEEAARELVRENWDDIVSSIGRPEELKVEKVEQIESSDQIPVSWQADLTMSPWGPWSDGPYVLMGEVKDHLDGKRPSRTPGRPRAF